LGHPSTALLQKLPLASKLCTAGGTSGVHWHSMAQHPWYEGILKKSIDDKEWYGMVWNGMEWCGMVDLKLCRQRQVARGYENSVRTWLGGENFLGVTSGTWFPCIFFLML